ncbi:hypothetical protein HY485_02305 [Candidatus Woesearchaeota archaeon]|nr:hypothetical protein [Candidatus Woesearchaeota archaeon]
MQNKKLIYLVVFTLLLSPLVLAYSLSQFPEPFVHDNIPAPNFAIVVGDNAAGSDVLGAIDVALSLQAAATLQPAEEEPIIQQQQDTVSVGSRSELFAINKNLGNVREAFTERDLDMLRGGTIVTQQRATRYRQYLRFANNTGLLTYDKNSQGVPGDYLTWGASDQLFEWQLQFDQGLTSAIKNGDLEDLEDETINVLGQSLVIADTDFTESTGRLVIKLLGGAMSAILGENEQQTYTIDDKKYTIEVIALSPQANNGEGSVKFRVNGEITEELRDGSIAVLRDGTRIGIESIVPSTKDIQKSIVQFYLGAYSIMLEDRKITDASGTIGGASVDGIIIPTATVRIDGNVPVSNTTLSIDSIRYTLTAEPAFGELFIPQGKRLREYLKYPEALLVPDWDIYYNGLANTGETTARLTPAGQAKYVFDFVNQEGIRYSTPLLIAQQDCLRYGDEDNDLWYIESNSPTTYYGTSGDFFVLSTCTSSDNTCATHILKYRAADTSGATQGQLRLYFTDLGKGEYETALTQNGNTYEGTISAGDGQFAARADNVNNPNGMPNISIDLNGDGAFNNGEAVIGIKGDGLIDLGNTNTNESNQEGRDARICTNPSITLQTLSKEFDTASTNENIPFTIQARTDNNIGIATPITATAGYFSGLLLKQSRTYEGLSGYGARFEFNDPGNKAETITIHYPLSQRGADITIGKQKKTEEQTTMIIEKTKRTPMANAVKLSSQVYDIKNYNSIIIGGACANPIAATLQGNPQPCWQSIANGVAIVKAHQHTNGNVAILVAGRNAQDTRRATTALANGMLKNVKTDTVRVTQGTGKINIVAV